MIELAPAKINLALHVRGRRADGYHDIETLFAFARDGDRVTVTAAAADEFTVTGPFASALGGTSAGDNIVVRARDAFTRTFAIDARHAIELDKRLPVASGIGGGSADAAATLRALASLHGVERDVPALDSIARALGADVPACLVSRPALGSGRGDDLVPLDPLGDVPALLVNPGVPVSTAAVFAAWDGADRGALLASATTMAATLEGRNDLEDAAIAIAPTIGDVLQFLAEANGATVSRMSGSGATCFALFATVDHRDAAAGSANARGWWTLATTLV